MRSDPLSQTADTILDKTVRISVEILNPRWWERILIRLGWLPSKRVFEVRPAFLGTMIRVSKLMLTVEPARMVESVISANYLLFEKHGDCLAEVVATLIDNSEAGPSKGLIRFIKRNMTADELFEVSQVLVGQLNVENFLRTITLLRGVSLLNPGGTIASGAPSEAS